MVDGAIAAGKFTADKKEHFLTLGKSIGAESLKMTLDAMQSVTKPMQLIKSVGGTAAQTDTAYQKLSDVPADRLKLMRTEDPDQYKSLYKAEYGVDCPALEE